MESLLLSYGIDWLNLLVRWLHLIVGIAWIGASFYFIWLDNSIKPPRPGSDEEKKGVSGELWAVHGGGFYHPVKYMVAPHDLPQELHWFKWEAYWTWLSGFAMLFIVYYFNASAMMIDKSVADINTWTAIAIGIGSLAVAWFVYDQLCRSRLGQHERTLGLVMFVFFVAAAYILSKWLSGRAAYIHVGAMIGSVMVANVAHVIIPGQRKVVAAMRAGQVPDAIHGIRGKQRSVHNNYFTLPVLFIMLSNHYAMTYNNKYNWLVLAAIMAAGVLIRHYFNLRHKGRNAWGYPAAGVALLFVVAVAIAPKAPAPMAGNTAAPDFAQVRAVIDQRCVACHSSHPTQPGFAAAPAGILLDSPDLIHQHAAKIYQQAVQLKAMPIGNLTNITEQERALLGAWFQAGAK